MWKRIYAVWLDRWSAQASAYSQVSTRRYCAWAQTSPFLDWLSDAQALGNLSTASVTALFQLRENAQASAFAVAKHTLKPLGLWKLSVCGFKQAVRRLISVSVGQNTLLALLCQFHLFALKLAATLRTRSICSVCRPIACPRLMEGSLSLTVSGIRSPN